jgi:HlyD family secretion protein
MAANALLNSKPGKRGHWWLIAVVVLAIIIFAAFMSLGRHEVPVRATRARKAEIRSTISTNGKIEGINGFEAHAPAATTVKQILVTTGQQVKAGQLLVQLDDADARAQAAKAQAQLRAAEADLNAVRSGGTRDEVLTTESQLAKAEGQVKVAERNLQALRRLQSQGAASAGEIQNAEGRLQSAQADLELARKRETSRFSRPEIQRTEAQAAQARAALEAARNLLAHSEIRAPRAGTVYYLPLREGQFVSAGDMLVQVADLRNVRVRAFVDEPDIGRLSMGEAVEVTWDAFSGRIWKGAISNLPSSIIALGSRNVGEVTCTVANEDFKLLPNVNVSVSIITAQAASVLTVPREAVHQEAGQSFVFRIENGVLKRHNVQTGLSNLTTMQITGGLDENAVVALNTVDGRPMQNGMSVKTVGE